MSFLGDIKNFSKLGRLKKTATEVTYIDGRRVREVTDTISGAVTSEILSVTGLGFVGDYKPDLQVAAIMPDLYLGSQDVAADLQLLRTHKISHILNAAARLENTHSGLFVYENLNILDLPETHIPDYFPKAFAFIDAGRGVGNVFVHCNAGVSRAASVVIGYVMRTEKIGFQEAYDHVKAVRPAVRPNDGFMKQLKEYTP